MTTNFMDSIRAQVEGKLTGGTSGTGLGSGITNPPRQSRDLIRTHRWDGRAWTAARTERPVDDLIDDLYGGDEHKGGERKEFDGAPELVEGVFHTFHKANPQLTPKREVTREMYGARKIIEEIMEHPRLRELQDMTLGDTASSIIAVDAMGDTMREILSRIPPPPPPPSPGGNGPPQPGDGQGQGQPGQGGQGQGQGQPDPNAPPSQGGQDGGQGNDPGDPQGGDGDGNDEDLTQGDAEWDPSADDAEQAESDWENEYDEALNDLDLDRAINKAMNDAADEVEDLKNARHGIGLEDGEWQNMSPEKRLEMAERLRTPEMKALANIVGQMKRFAMGVKATRVNDVPHEAFDVETGGDIRRALRPQLGLLATPETSMEFFRRMVDGELLQFKMRGKEEIGKGPIVVCIDKSYSMSGSPFHWAMGVAEALRRFAADEDRDYYALFFGTNDDRHRFEFPKGKGPFEKVLTFLSSVANGGTQFDGVLTEALERATQAHDANGHTKADIVFITDGQAHLSEQWIESFKAERDRVGVRMYSIYIGGASDMSAKTGPLGLLNQISDAAIPIKELRPESAKHIFQHV